MGLMSRSTNALVAGLSVLLFLAACGCAPAELPEASVEPGPEPGPALDQRFYDLPAGATAAELAEFIDRMRAFRPAAANRDELNEHRRRSSLAIIEAAERLLAMQPDVALEEQAQLRRFEALFMLAKYGDEAAARRLAELAADLRAHPSPAVADMAVLYTLTRGVEQLLEGGLPPAERQQLVDEAVAELESESFDPRMGDLAVELTRALERAGDRERALQSGERFARILSTRPEYADQFDTLQAAVRRLGLLGRKLSLQGYLFSGEPLDVARLEGKVVLIDFWATWCRPCLEDLPRLRGLYEMYQPLGFEVLGVSLDEDREALESFLGQRKLPWPVICGRTAEEAGFRHPLAVACGVQEIPTTVLLDQAGVVVAVDVYGEDIERRLHVLLGNAAHRASAPGGRGKSSGPTAEETRPAAAAEAEPCHPVPPVGPQTAAAEPRAATTDAQTEQLQSPATETDAPPPPAAQEAGKTTESSANPYLAPRRYTAEELAAYLEKALAKPRRVQERAGFLDAVVEAADRLLNADAPEELKLAALLAKFHGLHGLADSGNDSAARALAELVDAHAEDPRPEVAAEVRLHLLARRAAQADDMPPADLPALLEELKAYFSQTELNHRHLSLASATVHAINLLPDAAAAARWYRAFGELFAASEDRELSAYGKKLRRAKAANSRVGQPLELEGTAVDGRPFSWEAYRGKVVLVDFWATWCGPCRDELPYVKQNFERWREHGFEVVGISLDEDREKLLAFVKAEGIAWVNLFGEGDAIGWKHPMAVKDGVQAIPYMLLVDGEGKVLAEGVRGIQLGEILERRLARQGGPQ